MHRQIATACVVIMLSVTASGRQQDELALRSYAKARAVLDQGVEAIGGPRALLTLATLTREMSGVRTDEGQGLVPTDSSHNTPTVTMSIDFRTPRTAVELRDVITGGLPLHSKTIVTPDAVHSVDYVYRTLRTSKPGTFTILPQLRRSAEGLLRAALARPETLRWIGDSVFDGKSQQVIAFADADGTVVNLSFDAGTHLLTKSETLRDDPVLGDSTSELVFADYRPVEGLRSPFRYIERLGGAVLQDLKAASVTVAPSAADAFVPPADFPIVDSKPSPPLVALAENVYAIMGGYNSLAIAFPGYIVVLEGGGTSRATQNSIDLIHKTIPGRPIKYVVATHFHFDHVGGIRSYVAEGATIVTTPSAKRVIESRVLRSQHTMRPDRLTQQPVVAKIEVIDKRRVFEGGSVRLEVFDVGPSPHVGEMLIAYLPAQKVLFEADILDLPSDTGVPMAGDDTRHLAATITALGLDVERIVPVHGRLGSIADLRSAVSTKPANER